MAPTWKVEKTKSCPVGKPWGVINTVTGTTNGRCHASKAQAVDQQKAMYASQRKSMSDLHYVILPTKKFSEEEDKKLAWIQVFPYTTFKTQQWGEVVLDREKAERMSKNFSDKVRGIDINTDFEHGLDASKGTQASGWYRELEPRDDGLWGAVDFTEEAQAEIEEGKWKYFSPEYYDEWTDGDGNKHQDVLIGGALTNKPVIKGMEPINLSEVAAEVADLEHSEPGDPTPRQDQDDNDGKDTRDRIDGPPPAYEDENSMKLDEELRKILSLDADADLLETVKAMSEEIQPLRDAAKKIEARKKFAEEYPEEAKRLASLEATDSENKAVAFSEKYRVFHDKDGKSQDKGFPTVVVEKIKDVHKLFSEGAVKPPDFQELLDLIASRGIVSFSEDGSRRIGDGENENESDDPAVRLSEAVNKTMEEDKVDRATALGLVLNKNPDLAEAYAASKPVVR